MKKLILVSVLALFLTACGTSGDNYTTNEAPMTPDVPTNGSNIVVSAEGESNVGLTYTNVSEGSILVSCGDNCDLDVYEATKLSDEDATTCDEGFVWCPIELKCIPEAV